MSRRFIKQSKVLIIVIFCFVSNYCLGKFPTSYTQPPEAQFHSTSTMKTSYEVPALNQYGVANAPYQETYSSRPRRTEGNRDGGLPGTEGQEGTGESVPVGDVDLITILLMLGLGLTIKHTRNKQNSI